MPSTPISTRTSFTASNLDGCTIASSFVIFSSQVVQRFLSRHKVVIDGLGSRLLRYSQRYLSRQSRMHRLCRHTARTADRGDNILGISRNVVLVQIETVQFAFLGHAQRARGMHCVHHSQRDRERRRGNDDTTDELGLQQLQSSAVEQTLEGDGVVGSNGAGRAVLAAGEQA